MSAGVAGIDMDTEDGPIRYCTACTTWKPRTWQNFFNDKDGPLGVSRKCKPCDRAYQAQRRADIRAGNREVRKRVTNDAR